jgi:geranylgeranyl diphosphate synthase type I
MHDQTSHIIQQIEIELQQQISRLKDLRTCILYDMLTYHMGWTGEGAGPGATGKRIRPLLLLLTTGACGANWKYSLPAAAAIELIHNFSLVHDDIQDQSDLRRNRPSVWKKWGQPQAINAGDALLILAQFAVSDLQKNHIPEKVVQVNDLIHNACLDLTRGQFMDLSYEKRNDITISDYWPMIAGKTAALFSVSTHIGSILAGAPDPVSESYQNFGHFLGMAFQSKDDYLGIWGESAQTGKSSESDLATGKKSLPVLFGLAKSDEFVDLWLKRPSIPEDIHNISNLLIKLGAKIFTQETIDQMANLALQSLKMTNPEGWMGEALYRITNDLIDRQN